MAVALVFAAALVSGRESARLVQAGLTLAEPIRTEALPLMASANYLGLGSEASRLQSWVRERQSPFILRAQQLSLKDAAENRINVSPGMASALTRLNQWYGLVATSANPITHEQLKAASLSPASVDRIRRIFEKAIGRGLLIGGKWLTPEVGGEATIDVRLRLVEAPDSRWSMVQDLVRIVGDSAMVASHYEAQSIDLARIDTHGLLKVAVARLRLGALGAAEEVRRAVITIAENSAPTYTHDPEEQFALIASTDWRGRYVGRWHTHAPHYANGAWAGGDVPSFEDMQNAVQDGQYLTLAFQPEGFDLYDAAALADAGRVDLSLLKVIRYRSRSWRDQFQKLLPGLGKAR